MNHGRYRRHEPARPYAIPDPFTSYSPEDVTLSEMVPVPSLPSRSLLLPEIKRRETITSTVSVFQKPSVKRRFVRRVAKSIGLESSDAKNDRILSAMRRQFLGEKFDAILTQALSHYHLRAGPEANRPELYELYENGDIDKALENFGAVWVIGRPKI